MKIFKILRKSFKRSIRHDGTIVIYSLIIAILLWFIVSIKIYPETPKMIRDVPITIDLTGTTAAENNLEVVSHDVEKVNVQIQGNRSQVGNLKASDINAMVVVENVVNPGEYKLDINVTSKEGINFEVKSIFPEKVSVVFDVYETREFVVEAQAPNVTIEEGLYKGALTCTPETMKITGPKSQLDKIDKCVVLAENRLTLDNSHTLRTSEIKLYNKTGGPVDRTFFNMETVEFTVDIPVYMKKELKLNYTLQNVPSYFDSSVLKFQLTPETITVAAPKGSLLDQKSLNIGYINLREIDLIKSFTFEIKLPSNYQNLSNTTMVTAKLMNENLAKRTITVNSSEFKIINAPSSSKFNILTNSLTFDIIGPEEDIMNITDRDVVVEIDLMDEKIQSDSFSMDASIIIPNYKKVWSLGKHSVALEVDKNAVVPANVLP
ncbi:MAG: hypothetical protein GX286_04435 [Clostridiales bacterium]|jgi:YbbR domain-containing protein|nr:hypothetical protein [Clostridiales bacterium]